MENSYTSKKKKGAWPFYLRGRWHLRAVAVRGTVVEGGDYLLVFGLGGVVAHGIHELQEEGSVC